MTRLVQLTHVGQGRRVAKIEGDRCRLIGPHTTMYGLAGAALHRIAGAGHIPHLEKAAEVNALLDAFLSA